MEYGYEKIMRLCFVRKGKYRAKTRNIEKLYRKKRKLKIEYRKKEKTHEVVRLYKVQRQLINEYIEEEERKTIKDYQKCLRNERKWGNKWKYLLGIQKKNGKEDKKGRRSDCLKR